MDSIEKDWKWVFKIVFERILALGASAGISMTILYNVNNGYNQYALVMASVIIIMGFTLVSLSIVIFFQIPFINNIIAI